MWNGTGANVMALATMVQPGRLRACAASGRTSRSTRPARPSASLGRQARRRCRQPTASCVPEQLADLVHLIRACSTTPSPGSCRSPRAPSSAPSTPPTRSPRCATPRTGWAWSCTWTARASPTPRPRSAAPSPRCDRFTVDAGVDVLSFGGTKAGLAVRRGGRLPEPRAGRRGRSTSASRSTSCRRRCASSPPSSTPCCTTTCGSAWPSTPTRWAAACTTRPAQIPGVAHDAPPEVNSVFPILPPARDRAAAGVVLLLGLGRQPQPGAMDDRVGHHERRRRAVRGRSAPARWPSPRSGQPAIDC